MQKSICTELHDNTRFFIKYFPSIQSYTGSEKTALIVSRLEFWFSSAKFIQGFYKFLEPCSHSGYREGDSWYEELGFSRRAFNRAFDLIGVRYKSKSAFLTAPNTFQGKLYASYHDRKTNQTYYVRNHDFAKEFLGKLFSPSKKPRKTQYNHRGHSTSEPTHNSETSSTDNTTITKKISQKCRSWNDTNGRSIYNKRRQTSSLTHHQTLSHKESSSKMTEEMINVWKSEVGSEGLCGLSPSFFSKMNSVLQTIFNDSLDSWKEYCKLISSSKFLMGEANNKFFKKAWLQWALKEESVEKIRGGEFKTGDRIPNSEQKFALTRLSLENEKILLECKMESIKEGLKERRKKVITEKINALSPQEMELYKIQFEKDLLEKNDAITEQFKNSGWKGLFVEASFFEGLRENIESQLFSLSFEEEIESFYERNNLSLCLKNVVEKISTIKNNMLLKRI